MLLFPESWQVDLEPSIVIPLEPAAFHVLNK